MKRARCGFISPSLPPSLPPSLKPSLPFPLPLSPCVQPESGSFLEPVIQHTCSTQYERREGGREGEREGER